MSNENNVGAKLLLGTVLGLIFSALLYGSTPLFSIIDTVGSQCQETTATNTNLNTRDLEQDILSTTVRLHLRSWIPRRGGSSYEVVNSLAHATVKGGCCLVTHNHFDIPLPLGTGAHKAGPYTDITITDWRGKRVFRAPLADFIVVYKGEEVLVLALAEEQNSCWLEDLGFQSAHFSLPKQIDLQSGMKVAQVDWDGRCTRIDWTVANDFAETEHSRVLKLEDPIRLGASGGGIFYNGSHIANNWMLTRGLDNDGKTIFEHSFAISNDHELLEQCAK